MAIQATTRAELINEFYRLTATSASDGQFTANQTQAGDTINRYIQYGLWDAQNWYISNVNANRWGKTTSALTFTQDTSTGVRYVSLPSDFMRVDGDEDFGGLKYANTLKPWGRLIDSRARSVTGDNYYLKDTLISGDTESVPRLYLTRQANPPTSGLVLEYYYFHPEIADDADAIDFPTLDVMLIAAFAAQDAAMSSWFPGGIELKAAIAANLRERKMAALIRGRRTREPRKVRARRTVGIKWFA